MFENNDNKKESGNNKTKRRLTEVGIAVLILLALIIIKIVAGGKTTPTGGTAISPTIFDFYQLDIPDFDGKTYVKEIQNGVSLFKPDEITDTYYTHLSELDVLGRAGFAMMCADEEHIQEGERSSISDLKPSGWHSGGFYERSHLLMWKLTGLNKLENLVTGTTTFNEKNMQDYEKKVTRYLWDHPENHVMYRVTPLFKDKELVCRGVLMEAYSVEDDGALEFCVFVYNAEPGAEIDYLTGDYMENAENMTQERPEQQN
ncbi:MAG: DNA/RNA non-specific endonuclease [Parasporobacterium sp.]|nr:DNA/RNA non-specific endonuclease [Parasporobacterium sp.]